MQLSHVLTDLRIDPAFAVRHVASQDLLHELGMGIGVKKFWNNQMDQKKHTIRDNAYETFSEHLNLL